MVRGINEDNPALVQSGLDNGTNPNVVIDGEPALHKALVRMAWNAARTLIDHGADLNAPDKMGNTPLMISMGNRNLELTEYMMSRGADAKKKDTLSKTLLHYAAAVDRPDFISMLVKAGVDINAVDLFGYSPLHDACRFGASRESVSMLLKHGANVSAPNKAGQVPLAYLIVDADRHERSIPGPLALWLLMDRRTRTGVAPEERRKRMVLIAQDILDAGADPNARDNSGSTLLHLSVLNSFPAFSQELLRHGARVDVVDDKGNLPLHLSFYQAIKSSDLSIVSELIEKTPDINQANSLGYTPLHFAAILDKPQVIRQLLSRGARRDIKNKDGKLALDLARSDECKELLRL
jgi:ankyrin repeat protein